MKLDLKQAMGITDPAEADAWFNHYVVFIMDDRPCGIEEAQDIARQNLGYFSGYYDTETQRRVEKLYQTKHPIFGAVDDPDQLTTGQTILLGALMGSGHSLEDAKRMVGKGGDGGQK